MLAILLGLLPFVVLELALRVLGVAAQVDYQDPLVGFSRISPLFERDDADDVYRINRSRLTMFHEQEFSAVKPTNGFRAFCLGGSTVRGHPYENPTAFARWMELELSQRDPSRQYEVVNCGGLSYASYRLLGILREVLKYDPDLIVVATGHNEFLEDRTYGELKARSNSRAWLEDRVHDLRLVRMVRQWTQPDAGGRDAEASRRTILPEEVEARLDHHTGYAAYHRDEEWSRGVVEHFDRSIRTMIATCQQAGVPIVLVELGSNVRDCPPFKSEHRAGLTASEQLEWERLFDAGSRRDVSSPAEALGHYRQAADLDAEYALLQYRMARCLDRLGRTDEAREAYLTAKDADVCPLRMTEEIGRRLNVIAAETETPLIPARQLIESHIPSRIAGNEWYLDHVHPSILAHQMIARAIVDEMEQTQVAELGPWSETDRRRSAARQFVSLGPLYLREGTERLMWLENWARRQRLVDETRPLDPPGHLRMAWKLWDLDQREPARQHLEIALDDLPPPVDDVLERAFDLFRQGRGPEAIELLQWLSARPAGAPDADLIAALIGVIEQDIAGVPTAQLAETLAPFVSDSPDVVGRWRRVLTE